MSLGYSLLSKLADQGIAYLLLVIAIVAVVYLFRSLLKEKDKELKDKEITNVVLRSVDDTMKELIVEIYHHKPYERNKKK